MHDYSFDTRKKIWKENVQRKFCEESSNLPFAVPGNAKLKLPNIPLYVHNKSHHPPKILDNIPAAINKRLSEISSDEDSFQRAMPLYQEALTKSGYQHKLKYQQPPTSQNTVNSRSRKRNMTWYNPPFSQNVATNIGQTFLKILDEEFPADHILHKIFNRNTVKISYSCMSNFRACLHGGRVTLAEGLP
jgi:hypothetical protein